MKALTVRNPWAGRIIAGTKTIENRKNRPLAVVGKRMAIHAGLQIGGTGYARREVYGRGGDLDLAALAEAERQAGHIIGTVLVEGFHVEGDADCEALDCGRRGGMFTEDGGPKHRKFYHWELASARGLIVPVPARGALGLWDVPLDILAAVKNGDPR